MSDEQTIGVYLEIGSKRTFAGALDWPGWCRAGRNETSALQALLDYTPRYARVLTAGKIPFHPPQTVADFQVVERLPGSASTDFGTPGAFPSADARPVDGADLHWLQEVLTLCWREFETISDQAAGKELRLGPRGGGRQLEEIVHHVIDAEAAYLARLGWKLPPAVTGDLQAELERLRQSALDGLAAAARGELPAQGPRGGMRWSPRYYARRSAWHLLDHAWEIEDREQ